jgi:hypothetical protein
MPHARIWRGSNGRQAKPALAKIRGEDAPAQAEPRAPATQHLKLWYVERD